MNTPAILINMFNSPKETENHSPQETASQVIPIIAISLVPLELLMVGEDRVGCF